MAELSDIVTLRNFGFLVEFHGKCWTAVRRAPKAAEDAEKANNVARGAIKAQKSLFVGNDRHIRRIRSEIEAARQTHYVHTLPWHGSGRRLLANTLWPQYVEEIGKHEQALKARVMDLVEDYPALMRSAQRNLGDLFDPSDYPTALELPALFKIDYEFSTINDADDFKQNIVHNWMLERLQDHIAAHGRDVIQQGMDTLWRNAHHTIVEMAVRTRTSDSLKNTRSVFVGNSIASFVRLQQQNIVGDPELHAILDDVIESLEDVTTAQIKSSETLRTSVHTAMQDALQRLHQHGYGTGQV